VTAAVIRAFVRDTLAPARGLTEVPDGLSLVDSGIVDSLGIFQLIAFLEDTFAIRVGDEEITPENFETIEAIERLVETRVNRS
jgi:acyl carrier protein